MKPKRPRLLKPGEIITKAGQYDMTMDQYHGQPCDGVSVSSSGLRTIELESPADFWAYSDLNENRYEQPRKEAFTFGRAAHSLLLGDEDFNENFAVVPLDAPPKPLKSQIQARINGRISDAARERFDFWDAFEAESAGKELLTAADLLHIFSIKDSLERSPIARLLLEGEPEQSLIFKDEETGIWVKSRIDVLSKTGDFADLKTTVQTKQSLLFRDISKRGYAMQLAVATIAAEEVLGIKWNQENYEARGCFLIFVTKSPPYHVFPVEIHFDDIERARWRCRRAINTLAECLKTNEWPGPLEGILTYTSEWEAEQLMEEQAQGLLPTRW